MVPGGNAPRRPGVGPVRPHERLENDSDGQKLRISCNGFQAVALPSTKASKCGSTGGFYWTSRYMSGDVWCLISSRATRKHDMGQSEAIEERVDWYVEVGRASSIQLWPSGSCQGCSVPLLRQGTVCSIVSTGNERCSPRTVPHFASSFLKLRNIFSHCARGFDCAFNDLPGGAVRQAMFGSSWCLFEASYEGCFYYTPSLATSCGGWGVRVGLIGFSSIPCDSFDLPRVQDENAGSVHRLIDYSYYSFWLLRRLQKLTPFI